MGKNKQIRNLELEVERLRKNVITLENSIDKLLSDTITDQEKNVIKLDRHFAKATAAEFDKYLLSGSNYTRVSEVVNAGTFTPNDKQKADVEAFKNNFNLKDNIFLENLKNNPNLVPGEGNINPEDTDHIISTKDGRQYRHTEEGDKVHKAHQDQEEMVTIQVPVRSFIVLPTDNVTINNHLAVIQEELQKQIDNTVTLKDVNVWGHNVGDVTFQKSELLDIDINSKGSFILLEDIGNIPASTVLTFNGEKGLYISKDGYVGLPPGIMLDHWNQRKVRRLSHLKMCGEHQVCAPAKEEECKTSEKWLVEIPSEYKVKITDPDGWDRSNFEYSFKAECINKKEFIKRLMYSSIICHVSFWVSDWANK